MGQAGAVLRCEAADRKSGSVNTEVSSYQAVDSSSARTH